MRLLDAYDGFVLDLDGTVYLGDALLDGAAETIAAIRARGRPLVYITNKPLEPSAAYAAKLTALGVPTRPTDVVSSADALVTYLGTYHAGASVLAVSEPYVRDLLRTAGHRVVDDPEAASIVVVSFDRTFDYAKLHAAYRAVQAGATIVATNPDRTCPTPDGGLPDCAAMLAAIEACTGATAEAIVGKPSAQMLAAAVERLAVPVERALLVGDRLETDTAMAARAGMASALVLTGVSGRSALPDAGVVPTYILDGIGDLLAVDAVLPTPTVR